MLLNWLYINQCNTSVGAEEREEKIEKLLLFCFGLCFSNFHFKILPNWIYVRNLGDW